MIINKVTTMVPTEGSTITDQQIQEHIDTQNADGYVLISVVDHLGWFRFFWQKTISE